MSKVLLIAIFAGATEGTTSTVLEAPPASPTSGGRRTQPYESWLHPPRPAGPGPTSYPMASPAATITQPARSGLCSRHRGRSLTLIRIPVPTPRSPLPWSLPFVLPWARWHCPLPAAGQRRPGAKGGGERRRDLAEPRRDRGTGGRRLRGRIVGCDRHAESWFGGSATAPSSLRQGHSRGRCPTSSSAQARTDHQACCSASAALATTTA